MPYNAKNSSAIQFFKSIFVNSLYSFGKVEFSMLRLVIAVSIIHNINWKNNMTEHILPFSK